VVACVYLLFILLALMLVAIAVCFYTRVNLELTYHQRGTSDTLTLCMVAPWGLVVYRAQMPVLEFAEDGWRLEVEPTFLETYRSLSKQYAPILKFLLQHVEVRSLTWQSTIGVGDAALTALASGALWAVKGTVLGLVQSRTRAKDEDVVVVVFPSFRRLEFQTFLQCIFSLALVHIIYAQGLLLWKRHKYRKGAVKKFGKSSYSGFDEDGHGKHQGHGGRKHHCG